MLRMLLVFAFTVIMGSFAHAWKFELHGAGDGVIAFEQTAGEWRLKSPGRKERWIPMPCGQTLWREFEDEFKERIENTPLRWPARADVPPRVETFRLVWKERDLFIPRGSDLGRWLAALPDQVAVKRTEEQILCRRGVK